MMKPRSAFVFGGIALVLAAATVSGVATASATLTEPAMQDPQPQELRDRVIQILTRMQEQNTFQRNVAHLSTEHFTPRDGQERVNLGSVYYQLPGIQRKNFDFRDIVAIFQDDKRTNFMGPRRTGTDARTEPVMSTLLDITAIEPEQWIRRARSLGIDPDKVNEQQWKDKTYIVIGGEPGQLNVPQIWIEKETLRPARAITYQVRGADRIFDYQIIGYETFEDGSIFPSGVEMYEGSWRVNRDEWSRFEINREEDPDFFDPDKVEEALKMGGAPAVRSGGGGG